MGFSVVPSQANFLMTRIPSVLKNGKNLCELLHQEGIIIRGLDPYGLNDSVRITVGSHVQNTRLLDSLKGILQLESSSYKSGT
jgi:histidinol-phosphate aminotransferase